MKGIYILTLALALAVVVTGLALANGGVERPREVLGSGASDFADGGVSVRVTLGQSVVGVVSDAGGEITLGQGFWHGGGTYRIYLPLLFRDHL